MKRTALRAFTLPELLIVILVMSILGGAIVAALGMMVRHYTQTEDVLAIRSEIEHVYQTIGREITNVALGMPNNLDGTGNFAEAFRNPSSGGTSSIMSLMGESGRPWGGPITLMSFDVVTETESSILSRNRMVQDSSGDIYTGPQILYAWGLPAYMVDGGRRVPIRVGDNTDRNKVIRGEMTAGDSPETFHFSLPGSVMELLSYSYDGRDVGIIANAPRHARSWITFPTVRIPMLVTDIDPSAESNKGTVTLQMAPGSGSSGKNSMSKMMGGYEEVHFVQVTRLYVNAHEELIRDNFSASAPTGSLISQSDVLARNVVGMFFRYDAANRLLTMSLAVRGQEDRLLVGAGEPDEWPDYAPALSDAVTGHRIHVQNMTWRIRN